jgi:hypothetical protein
MVSNVLLVIGYSGLGLYALVSRFANTHPKTGLIKLFCVGMCAHALSCVRVRWPYVLHLADPWVSACVGQRASLSCVPALAAGSLFRCLYFGYDHRPRVSRHVVCSGSACACLSGCARPCGPGPVLVVVTPLRSTP